ncbi:aluminum-activated malate transporter 8-like [Vigna radiata var. radiata]|uniref:Aluminum-activated malate transporter 8-like n=1 Tax=Vigna radiata var. radiata TaxID=3916 RepID=A0A1S3T9E0_VIGRR|nr:aluminum-activated malate transporter 8-like [Vigna radiata var. radiata]
MVVKLGKDDPRRITHSLKFGFALVLISILQYFRPSFYVLGDNIIWAVITVILVLEFSVGATLGKGLNRVLATTFAGGLAVALREIASFFGDKGKLVMITVSDLHNQIASNVVKIADFLEGFRDEYFNNLGKTAEAEDDKSFLHRYESILSSKTNEETMAVLARWEPRHGRFRFRHPWKQYLKIGNQIRLCAYKIKALSVFLSRSDQTPYEIRSGIEEPCANIIMESGKALKESSLMLKQFAKAGMPNPHVANAKNAAESLKSVLRRNPWEGADHLQIIPAATVASLLIDIVFCVEKICEAVEELANLANFELSEVLHRGTVQPIPDTDAAVHVITIAE